MVVRLGLVCCTVAALLTGCTQWVQGAPLRAASEPAGPPTGIVDVDQVLLTLAQMRAITGAGQDLSAIPGMGGTAPVDIDSLADLVPTDCRFIFAETATFGPELQRFHKISYQYPPRKALISQAAAASRDGATARGAFDGLAAAAQRCSAGRYGPAVIGDLDVDAESLHTRAGRCGRDYRLKASVMLEVTFCALPDSVPEIVMANIVSKIPAG